MTQLHGLLSAKERIDRLKGMGIETPTELRAALREYIGLKEEAKRDKIKEMEFPWSAARMTGSTSPDAGSHGGSDD